MKNIIIVVLAVACAGLSYMQFGMPQPEAELVPTPVVEEVAELEPASAPLHPVDLIKTAEAEGVTLTTAMDEVDALAESAGYACNKNENHVVQDGVEKRDAMWQCTHKELDRVKMTINAKGGEIKSIYRSGVIMLPQYDETVAYVDDLKSRLAGKQGLSFSQTAGRTIMQVNSEDEAGQRYALSYRVQLSGVQDLDTETQPVGTYTVSLTR